MKRPVGNDFEGDEERDGKCAGSRALAVCGRDDEEEEMTPFFFLSHKGEGEVGFSERLNGADDLYAFADMTVYKYIVNYKKRREVVIIIYSVIPAALQLLESGSQFEG